MNQNNNFNIFSHFLVFLSRGRVTGGGFIRMNRVKTGK